MAALLLLIALGHWTKEPGIRVEQGSVPYVVQLGDTAYRLYHTGPGGICSSISRDGLAFQTEPGVRVPNGPDSMQMIVADPTVVTITDGYRMYYKGATGPGGPGQARHRIFSAVSADGLDWTKEGLRYQNLGPPDNGWTSVPDAIRLPDGRIRIYYTSATGGIRSIISDNGLDFLPEDGIRLNAVDPNCIYLPDSSFRLFFSTQVGQSQHIGFADSPDGLSFTLVDTIISPGGPNDSFGCIDPSAIILSNGRTRVYYGGVTRSSFPTLSAISPAGAAAENRATPECAVGVAPNPCRGILTVRLSLADNRAPQNVSIRDVSGRLVHSSLAVRDLPFAVDLRSLPDGAYFVSTEATPKAARLVLVR